jgi:hypothetical protein
MRKLITICLVLLIVGVAYGITNINYQNVANPRRCTSLLKDIHGTNRNIYTFGNGATLDNLNDNALEFNENSDELIMTFGSNTVTFSSGDVTTIDFGTLTTKSDSFLCDPVSSATATEGRVYYDSDDHSLYVRTNSDWVSLNQSAAASTPGGSNTQIQYNNSGSLGGVAPLVYDGSYLTLIDTHALGTGTDRDWQMYWDYSYYVLNFFTDDANSSSTEEALYTIGVDNGNTGMVSNQEVFEVGKGSNSDAYANWVELFAVDEDGDVSAAATITSGTGGFIMDGGAIISNDTDTEIKFTENSEDFSLDFTTDEIDLKSSSGVATVGWGDLDAFTGLNSITMDAAASTITLAADGAADDLTISVTGATNSSLVLSSAGTSADALQIMTTAGGIDITNGGASGGEDIDIVSSNSSVVLNGGEGVADSIRIYASNAAGGIDVDFGTSDMVITGTGASADFTLDADLISIDGTGTSNITCTNGAGEDFTIATSGAADHSLVISATGTAADAMQITTSAGGIDITNGGAADGEDIDVTSTSASFILTTGEDVADSVTINSGGGIDIDSVDDINIQVTAGGAGEDLILAATGAQDTSVTISSSGTAANAIDIDTTAGGIDIDMSGGAADEDFQITTATSIDFISTEAAAGQFKMDAQGTVVGYGIILETTDGGVQINADGADNGDISIDAADDLTLTAAGDLTLTVTGTTDLGTVFYDVSITDDTDNETLAATQSGGIFTNQGDSDNQVYTLPTAAAGLVFTFLDVESGAGADLYIRANSGDTINGGTANQYYGCKTDAVGQSVTVIAVNATEWIVSAEVGTWVNDDTPD